MSYEFYKVIHLAAIMLLFASLGGVAILSTRPAEQQTPSHRGFLAMCHGVALLLVFVAGFGMMARLGLMSVWPAWILGKLAIWVLLGGSLVLVRKQPGLAKVWLFVLPALGAVAAYLAIQKPG